MPFLSFAILDGGKYLARNLWSKSCYLVIELEGKYFNLKFYFSPNENGNFLSLMAFRDFIILKCCIDLQETDNMQVWILYKSLLKLRICIILMIKCINSKLLAWMVGHKCFDECPLPMGLHALLVVWVGHSLGMGWPFLSLFFFLLFRFFFIFSRFF